MKKEKRFGGLLMNCGELVRKIRCSKKMTLQKVAKNVISPSTLAKFERGESNLSVESFLEVLQNLHISLHQFGFFYENEQIKKSEEFWHRFKEHTLKGEQLQLLNDSQNKRGFKYQLKTAYSPNRSEADVMYFNEYFFEVDVWSLDELRLLAFKADLLNIQSLEHCRSVLEEQILADTYDGAYLVEVYEVLLSLYSELLVNKKHFKPKREVYEYIQVLDMKYLWYQHWLSLLLLLNDSICEKQMLGLKTTVESFLCSPFQKIPYCVKKALTDLGFSY